MFRSLHSFISSTSMWSAHQSQLRLFCSRVPGRPVPSPCLLHPVSSPADFPGSVLLGSSTSNHFTLSSRFRTTSSLLPSLHRPSLPFSLFPVPTLSIFPSLLPLILSIYSSLSHSPSLLPSSWPRGLDLFTPPLTGLPPITQNSFSLRPLPFPKPTYRTHSCSFPLSLPSLLFPPSLNCPPHPMSFHLLSWL